MGANSFHWLFFRKYMVKYHLDCKRDVFIDLIDRIKLQVPQQPLTDELVVDQRNQRLHHKTGVDAGPGDPLINTGLDHGGGMP